MRKSILGKNSLFGIGSAIVAGLTLWTPLVHGYPVSLQTQWASSPDVTLVPQAIDPQDPTVYTIEFNDINAYVDRLFFRADSGQMRIKQVILQVDNPDDGTSTEESLADLIPPQEYSTFQLNKIDHTGDTPPRSVFVDFPSQLHVSYMRVSVVKLKDATDGSPPSFYVSALAHPGAQPNPVPPPVVNPGPLPNPGPVPNPGPGPNEQPPVDGACGESNGVPTASAPTDLCAVGVPTTPAPGPDQIWRWVCGGENGGATSQCSAPILPACDMNQLNQALGACQANSQNASYQLEQIRLSSARERGELEAMLRQGDMQRFHECKDDIGRIQAQIDQVHSNSENIRQQIAMLKADTKAKKATIAKLNGPRPHGYVCSFVMRDTRLHCSSTKPTQMEALQDCLGKIGEGQTNPITGERQFGHSRFNPAKRWGTFNNCPAQ